MDIKTVFQIATRFKSYTDFKSHIDKVFHDHPETAVSEYEYILIDKREFTHIGGIPIDALNPNLANTLNEIDDKLNNQAQ